MLALSIGWILILSGAATAAGGFAACLLPRTVLQSVFGAKSSDGLTMFFVRHGERYSVWSAHSPFIVRIYQRLASQASVIKKFAIVALIFLPTETHRRNDSHWNYGWNLGLTVRCVSCRAIAATAGLLASSTTCHVAQKPPFSSIHKYLIRRALIFASSDAQNHMGQEICFQTSPNTAYQGPRQIFEIVTLKDLSIELLGRENVKDFDLVGR
jgi:hypothetical protein